MRVLRTSLAMAAALGLAPALAFAQHTPQSLLTRYTPVFRGVDHDLPASAVKGDDPAVKAAVDACKVEANRTGFTVRDAQGKLLRRFLDTNGKKTTRDGEKEPGNHLDTWSYYQDGFEVYREVDSDEDGSLDEVRWMNSGGTRIAKVRPLEKGPGVRVVAWTRISPEEASKVLVQALVYGDRDLLESVLATPEELQSIGAPKSTLDRVTSAQAERGKAMAALVSTLKDGGWSGQTAWSRFDGAMPRVIPTDAAPGLKNEVVLYENVVIFADAGNPAANAKLAYLSAPEVVKIGDAWKFIELPHAVDPVKPTGGNLASLRTDIFKGNEGAPAGDPVADEALKALATHDGVPPAEGDKAKAEWHVARVKLLSKVVAAVKDPAEKLNYQKQAVNDLAEAVSTELYPQGLDVIDKMIAQGGKIASYAAQRKILVQFDLESKQPGVNLLQVQNATLEKFQKFLKDYPKAEEEPDVLLQLATVNDFNGDEKEARRWYAQLAKDYPTAEPGKKAAGALRRLDLDGKPLKLAGTGADGKSVSLDRFRGKPVVVVYWTSADAKELTDLGSVQQKLGAKGFEVVTVNLDADKAAAEAALKDVPSGWATIREEGGMDSRPANDLGIISTPTILLLDSKGVVVNRKIRKANEVEKAIVRDLAGRGAGLNGDPIR